MTDPHTQEGDEADLLPCPFCGGTKIKFGSVRDGSRIYCAACGAGMVRYHGKDPTSVRLASAWNTRADLDALRKENERLRDCLASTREEICSGPVDDTLWHTVIPACTTVDNICLALGDDWNYDEFLARAALTPHGAVTPETKGET